jgi:hypothetical protein
LPAVLLALTASITLLGAGPVIGVAISDGNFRINDARVSGTATVFEGSTIQTEAFASELQLKGSRIALGANSRAAVSLKRLRLEQGLGQIAAAPGYAIEARTLRITPVNAKSIARVQLQGSKKVVVAALQGPVQVFNRTGLLVLTMQPGTIYTLDPQAGAADQFDVTGCLLWKNGQFIIADPNGQISELQGLAEDLRSMSGNPVHITGNPGTGTPVAPAVRIIAIHTVQQTANGGCAAAAHAASAQLTPPGGKPPAAGKEAARHTGVYAGVAVAAGGAVAAAVVLASHKSKSP